jgi:Caspase domain
MPQTLLQLGSSRSLVGSEMKDTQLYNVRHMLTAICSLIGVALLAIGANAALDLHTSEATKVVVSSQGTASPNQLAPIIGNGNYPDDAEPLNQPINDASGLAYAMRRHGFDVDVVADGTKADMTRAVERLKSRIKPGSVVMLFFGGYGVQSRQETYMIPTDAVIWKERDVRHEGMSVETVLHAIKERGARATLAVLDASRRNPYERRFRSYSHGLAPVIAPNNALIISSITPGMVADGTTGDHSMLVTEFLNELNGYISAEGVFNRTRVAVFRSSNGAQMPWVSSSLLEDVHFGRDNDPDLTTSSLAPIINESTPLRAPEQRLFFAGSDSCARLSKGVALAKLKPARAKSF